ncbi:MAG: hypothetical protein J1E82_00260 [Muribaculaceae bacterium]|nr:hypothetical protein [Muribaculaceae bacterium]
MSQQEQEKRSGCSKPVVTFFIIAIAIVAAFLIIGLVRTCDTDHQDNAEQTEVVQQNVEQ